MEEAIRHLTGIHNLSSLDINSILNRAVTFSSQKNPKPLLKNKIVTNLFFENSTRTRFSFEVAAKKLNAIVLNFTPETSSLSKGETLDDTLKTFQSLGTNIAVIRHSDDQYIEQISKTMSFSVVNAGAGKNEHPSQSLLDLLTLKKEFKTLKGLKVLIVGDIVSSRVAKSNLRAFKKMGITPLLAGPSEWMPKEEEFQNVQKIALDEGLKICDAVMLLRIQKERHETFELNEKEYHLAYGLTVEREKLLKKKAIIMHPAPINHDVEIDKSLIESPKSRIFDQMENGVWVRMAIFEWLTAKNVRSKK